MDKEPKSMTVTKSDVAEFGVWVIENYSESLNRLGKTFVWGSAVREALQWK